MSYLFYSFPDVGFLKAVPQPLQHLAIKEMANNLNGKISFYGTELPETIKSQEILENQLDRLKNEDGIIFFSLRQFFYSGNLNIKLINKAHKMKLDLFFARENFNLKHQTSENDILMLIAHNNHYRSQITI